MEFGVNSTHRLNDGHAIPMLGLGSFQSEAGEEAYNATRSAIEIGYRHIDTAAVYGNEESVGEAITDCAVPHPEIFVTTKLWNSDQGYEKARPALEASLARLGLNYVDLYLIHWPDDELSADSWSAMIELRDAGLTRSIGVSNFSIPRLEKFLAKTDVTPAVNQVEFSPFLYQKDLLDYCAQRDILIEAYTPLTRGQRFGNETIQELSRKYGKSPAQIMIRWALQRGLVVIPKSAHRERIQENADVFDFAFEESDMESLDGLNENLRVAWYPSNWY